MQLPLLRDRKSGEGCTRRLVRKLISVSMILGHGRSRAWKRPGSSILQLRQEGVFLIDPGIHLLDLINVINDFKEMSVVGASAWQGFWKSRIEEEAHVLLRSTSRFPRICRPRLYVGAASFSWKFTESPATGWSMGAIAVMANKPMFAVRVGAGKRPGPRYSGGVGSKKVTAKRSLPIVTLSFTRNLVRGPVLQKRRCRTCVFWRNAHHRLRTDSGISRDLF